MADEKEEENVFVINCPALKPDMERLIQNLKKADDRARTITVTSQFGQLTEVEYGTLLTLLQLAFKHGINNFSLESKSINDITELENRLDKIVNQSNYTVKKENNRLFFSFDQKKEKKNQPSNNEKRERKILYSFFCPKKEKENQSNYTKKQKQYSL